MLGARPFEHAHEIVDGAASVATPDRMPAAAQARCPCLRCRLDFRSTFYLDRGVPDDDEATSLGGIGGSAQNGAVAFTTTHWSVVLTAQDESPAAQEALEKLCRTYWRPIFSFVRRQGVGPEEAE